MNGKTILAAVLGAVTHFLLGWIIYGMILMDFMESNMTQYEGLVKEESEAMVGYILSSVLFAILITYILVKSNSRTASSGLITAGIVTFLMGLGIDVMFYFGWNLYTSTGIIVDVIAFTIMGGLVGLVIGLVLGWGRENVSASMD